MSTSGGFVTFGGSKFILSKVVKFKTPQPELTLITFGLIRNYEIVSLLVAVV